jgi:hypothetical protein
MIYERSELLRCFELVIAMKKMSRHRAKIIVGSAAGALSMVLAFRRGDLARSCNASEGADYAYVLLGIIAYFGSVVLRGLRWRCLLAGSKKFKVCFLLSLLIIGYMVKVLPPAHLCEVIRAYVLGEKEKVPIAMGLASIVTERIIDVFGLLTLMTAMALLYPFPA